MSIPCLSKTCTGTWDLKRSHKVIKGINFYQPGLHLKLILKCWPSWQSTKCPWSIFVHSWVKLRKTHCTGCAYKLTSGQMEILCFDRFLYQSNKFSVLGQKGLKFQNRPSSECFKRFTLNSMLETIQWPWSLQSTFWGFCYFLPA